MQYSRGVSCSVTAVAAAAFLSATAWAGQRDNVPVPGTKGEGDDKKPSLSLKANPPVGFTPLKVHLVVEVRGGPNDYAEFYCPTIEWEWGDGTMSENSEDCDPYEAGKSTIRRRFSADHVYRQSDAYRVVFRIKQKTKTVAVAAVGIQVRPGMREDLGL